MALREREDAPGSHGPDGCGGDRPTDRPDHTVLSARALRLTMFATRVLVLGLVLDIPLALAADLGLQTDSCRLDNPA